MWDTQKTPEKLKINLFYTFHISIYNEKYILRELDQAVHLMLFLKQHKCVGETLKNPIFAKYAKFITLVKYYPGE